MEQFDVLIVGAATAMTRDEFIADQTAEALKLRAAILADADLDAQIADTRSDETSLAEKRAAMVEAVEREFGAFADIWYPEGGIFLWLQFPDDIDTAKVLPRAAESGVVFNEGAAWACDPAAAGNYLRLCFASPTLQEIDEGVTELAGAFHDVTGRPERGANLTRG